MSPPPAPTPPPVASATPSPKPASAGPPDSFAKPGSKSDYVWGPTYSSVRDGSNVLRRGLRGPAVEEVQKNLEAAGYKQADAKGRFDGKFGASTEAAVKKFQSEHGISPANGVVDQKTARALEAAAKAGAPVGGSSAGASGGAGGGAGAVGASSASPIGGEPSPERTMANTMEKASDMLESGKFKKGDNPKFDAVMEKLLAVPPQPLGSTDPDHAALVKAQSRLYAAAKSAGY